MIMTILYGLRAKTTTFSLTSPPRRSSCTGKYRRKLNPYIIIYELSVMVVVVNVGRYDDVKVMSKQNIYKTAYGIFCLIGSKLTAETMHTKFSRKDPIETIYFFSLIHTFYN